MTDGIKFLVGMGIALVVSIVYTIVLRKINIRNLKKKYDLEELDLAGAFALDAAELILLYDDTLSDEEYYQIIRRK